MCVTWKNFTLEDIFLHLKNNRKKNITKKCVVFCFFYSSILLSNPGYFRHEDFKCAQHTQCSILRWKSLKIGWIFVLGVDKRWKKVSSDVSTYVLCQVKWRNEQRIIRLLEGVWVLLVYVWYLHVMSCFINFF